MQNVLGPIVVAGGGIGGLTVAAGLQCRGLDVLVLEQQDEIRDAGAGISLWPNALAALDCLGLGQTVRALGTPLAEGGERKLNGRSGPSFSAKTFVHSLGEGLVCVDRGRLVRALVEILKPRTVRTGCAVTGYEQGRETLLIEVEGRLGIEALALVGADGVSSAVAKQMNGPLEFSYSGYTAWRGIADTVFASDREQIRACLAGGHEFGWMPVSAERTYWFATAWLPESHELPEGNKTYLSNLFANWPHPVLDLIERTPTDQVVRNDIVDRAPIKHWSVGPVTLVGDAAHPMRPHLGQGGCQAIEDAACLVTCVDGSPDTAEAFRRYEHARRKRAERIVRLSRYSGFTRPRGLTTTTFDRLTAILPPIPIGHALRAIRPIASYSAGAKAACDCKTPSK